jgi:predicted NACHT family NTPase
MFDGLDELLDTSERRIVSRHVETFAHRYQASHILVTSRLIGYSQAPLDDEVFKAFYIQEFDEGRVFAYSSKWFHSILDVAD